MLLRTRVEIFPHRVDRVAVLQGLPSPTNPDGECVGVRQLVAAEFSTGNTEIQSPSHRLHAHLVVSRVSV